MEKKESSIKTFAGCLTGILIFAAFIGFSVFIFWIFMQIFGWEL